MSNSPYMLVEIGQGFLEVVARTIYEAQAAELARLKERLEIGFAFDGDGNRVTVPETGPDGITCRDETIRLQDEAIDKLKQQVVQLTQKMQGWRVLIVEVCGHSVTDPLLNIVDPVELVTRKLAQLQAQLKTAREDEQVSFNMSASFFEALKPLNLQVIYTANPGQHVTDLIADRDRLQVALATEKAEHEEDVTQLVKHCACEFDHDKEGPTTVLVECAYHQGMKADRDRLRVSLQRATGALVDAGTVPTEEVEAGIRALTADRDRLSKERDEYKRKYDLVNGDPDYQQCCALREKAEADLTACRAALGDFRDHGLRADLHPTHDLNNAEVFWHDYIKRIEESVKERANAALLETL